MKRKDIIDLINQIDHALSIIDDYETEGNRNEFTELSYDLHISRDAMVDLYDITNLELKE